MPELRMWLKELDSHGDEFAINRFNVGDSAELLLPGLYVEQAQALAFSNPFPQLKKSAIGIDGGGEAFFFERRFVVDFPRDAQRDSREDALSSSV
jgi:hypothetical protein